MKTLMSGLLLSTAILVAQPALAEDFRVLSSWDTTYAPVPRVLDPFLERLSEESNGEITTSRSGPETIPPFEQLDPVSRGLFDMLFTNGAYHANQTAAGMTFDAVSATPAEVHESGMWDYIDERYQELGLKLIAVLYDMNGYNIILREPVTDNALEGRRVRGTPIYHPLIEELGGSPVVLPGNEIYSALERGVVDGAAWPTVGAAGFRWFEVADYLMRPTFGQVGHPVFMNLERWNSLDDETKELITRVAREFEDEAIELFDAVVAEEEETLAAEGMSVTELSDEYSSVIGSTWYDGAMNLAAGLSPDAVAEIRKIAEDAGLNDGQ
ncbi:TRAP transporter substrate-binding protein DctP [Amorphus sp. 3PC139-8]|uniref:TRAP transporter substrate-binding protein DctP n=1 Tax=Amorphus sp. 3PC139-8 TaxID=2735676 RepID=UPI00345E0288